MPSSSHFCYKQNAGIEGEYYAFDDGEFGQKNDISVVDVNKQPCTQPGLWCNFLISDDGTELIWNKNDKTYNGTEWIEYLIMNFLTPNGYIVNGEVKCYCIDYDHRWTISVKDNVVTTREE